MVDRSPSHEQPRRNDKLSSKEEGLHILHAAPEVIISEDPDKLFTLFSENISADHITQMRKRLAGLSRVALARSTELSDKLAAISDEMAVSGVVMRRARYFWLHGPELIENREDLEAWLGIVTNPDFFALADRNIIYKGERPPSSAHGARVSDTVTPPSALDLYKAMEQLGEGDDEYLTNLANRINEMTSNDAGTPPQIKALAKAIIASAQRVRGEESVNNSKGAWAKVGENRTIDEINKTSDVDNDALARKLVKLQEVKHKISTPSEVLARVEFLEVSLEVEPFFTALMPIMQDILKHDNPDTRRDSLDYVRGASRLLFSSLGFAASEAGLKSENAAKMYKYIYDTSGQRGRQITPNRKSLIALANQVAPSLKEALGHDDLPPLDDKDPFDTYLAIDRLFAFIEYEAESRNKREVGNILSSVADCALQLTDFGLKRVVVRPSPQSSQGNKALLDEETGPKARRNALHRIGKPGYGKIS